LRDREQERELFYFLKECGCGVEFLSWRIENERFMVWKCIKWRILWKSIISVFQSFSTLQVDPTSNGPWIFSPQIATCWKTEMLDFRGIEDYDRSRSVFFKIQNGEIVRSIPRLLSVFCFNLALSVLLETPFPGLKYATTEVQ
jgi:hypothetical protein